MKKIQLESWTTYEKMCLASAIQRTGDQNWTAVSRAVKSIYDESTRSLGSGWKGRPPDWFNMRQCAAQYEHLLNDIVGSRKKKRTDKANNDTQLDSPADIILSVLRQDHIEELKVILIEQQMTYLKLKKEMDDIEAGLLDDNLEDMLAEEEAKEREKEIKIKLKFKLGEKNIEGDQSTLKSESDISSTPHTENEVKSSSATSPLLTSLLQSPSPLSRHPMAPPPSTTTISLLLNSSPSVPSSETSTLTKLLESPTAAAVAAGLISPTQSPTIGAPFPNLPPQPPPPPPPPPAIPSLVDVALPSSVTPSVTVALPSTVASAPPATMRTPSTFTVSPPAVVSSIQAAPASIVTSASVPQPVPVPPSTPSPASAPVPYTAPVAPPATVAPQVAPPVTPPAIEAPRVAPPVTLPATEAPQVEPPVTPPATEALPVASILPQTDLNVVDGKEVKEDMPDAMEVDPLPMSHRDPVESETQTPEVNNKTKDVEAVAEEEEIVEETVKAASPDHSIEEIVHSEVETEIVIEPEQTQDDKRKGVARRLDLDLCDVTTEEEVVETVERIIEKVEEAVILDAVETEEEVLETVEQIIEKVEEAIIETMVIGGEDTPGEGSAVNGGGEAGSDASGTGSEARSLNQTLESEAADDALDSLVELDQEAVELIVVGPNQPSPVIAVHHEMSSDTQIDTSKSDEPKEIKDLDSTEIVNDDNSLNESTNQKTEITLSEQLENKGTESKGDIGESIEDKTKLGIQEEVAAVDVTDSVGKLEELDKDVIEEHEVQSEEVVLAEEVIAEEQSEAISAKEKVDSNDTKTERLALQVEEQIMEVDSSQVVSKDEPEGNNLKNTPLKPPELIISDSSKITINDMLSSEEIIESKEEKAEVTEEKDDPTAETMEGEKSLKAVEAEKQLPTPTKAHTEKLSTAELKSHVPPTAALDVGITSSPLSPDKKVSTPIRSTNTKLSQQTPSPVTRDPPLQKTIAVTPVKTETSSMPATPQRGKEPPPVVESEKRRAGRKRTIILSSDSKPNSPASSILTEEDRDHKSWKKSILLVYNRLAAHKYASVFLKPITEAEAAGYHSIIKRPMDLTTIKRNIETGAIRTTVEFQRDMLLMVQNAIMYNKTNTLVYKMANDMLTDMIAQMEVMVQAIGDGVPLGRDTYERLPTRGRAAAKAAGVGVETGKRKRNSGPDDRQPTKRSKYDPSLGM